MFVKFMLVVCMLVGSSLSESGLRVFRKLCPVSFLVVIESPSVGSVVVCSHVVC